MYSVASAGKGQDDRRAAETQGAVREEPCGCTQAVKSTRNIPNAVNTDRAIIRHTDEDLLDNGCVFHITG